MAFCPHIMIIMIWVLVNSTAYAAAPEEPKSKRVTKIMRILNTVGVTHPEIKALVNKVDRRVKDGYLNFGQERIAGGLLTLHYEMHGGIKARQMELKYQPDDSNISLTARTSAVMASYSLNF